MSGQPAPAGRSARSDEFAGLGMTMPTQSQEIQAAIARAKQEWECTVDALPQLVCLLDRTGHVVRANRVVEHWGLGEVAAVAGRNMHALLHPACTDPACEWRVRVASAWAHLQHGSVPEFELEDELLARTISVDLRRLPSGPNGRVQDKTFAVMVVADVTDLRRAGAALQMLNVTLETRVAERTRELAAANEDLRSAINRREVAEEALRVSRDELALLSQQLMRAQEAERKRIASELHDSIGQSLSAVKYTLERVVVLLREWRLDDPEPLLLRAIGNVQDMIKEIRLIAMNLRPSVLDDLGAASAVAWLCREFAETYPGIATDVQLSVADSQIPVRLATAVFRSVQELLNNVAKHSQARRARISLHRDAVSMTLEVSDDGIGLPNPNDSLSTHKGHGLRNLRERAEMTRGQLSLPARPEGGTLVRIEWFLSAEEAEAGGDSP